MEGLAKRTKEGASQRERRTPLRFSPLPVPCPAEEELFSLLESERTTPLTVTVRADGRLYERVLRVYSVSAFVPISLLLCGIDSERALQDALEICHGCYCDLYAAGRECNGFFPRGILIDSLHTPPLSPVSLSGIDFVSFDHDRLAKEIEGRCLQKVLGEYRSKERHLLCRSFFDAELAALCAFSDIREVYLPKSLLPSRRSDGKENFNKISKKIKKGIDKPKDL